MRSRAILITLVMAANVLSADENCTSEFESVGYELVKGYNVPVLRNKNPKADSIYFYYDSASSYDAGSAVVEVNEKYGIIDIEGNWIMEPKSDMPRYFEGGYGILYRLNQAPAFTDTKGKILFSVPDAVLIQTFSDGVALFRTQFGDSGKVGYFDKTGKTIIKPQFADGRSFNEGLAAVQPTKGGLWGFIDKKGQIVIKPQFNEASGFFEGLAGVKLNGQWGFINKQGRLVIPPQFSIGPYSFVRFEEGLAKVLHKGKWGFINQQGQMIIPAQYDDASSFSEGLATVQINGKWGFIDRKGAIVIPPQFDYADSFSEGLAPISLNDLWGFIDKKGKIVIKPSFQGTFGFRNRIAPVEMNKKWGYMRMPDCLVK